MVKLNTDMNKLLIIGLLPLLIIGCTTTNTNNNNATGGTTAAENIKTALPYVAPAVTLACTVVLEQAVSPQDRVEKAKMINHVATVVEGLTRGSTPTPDELQDALEDYLPTEKTHWVSYVNVVKDIYAQQFARLNGDGKLAVDVLNAIAKGCKDATASYTIK
jgi:hypothetical protein